jgi:hypothetical protein
MNSVFSILLLNSSSARKKSSPSLSVSLLGLVVAKLKNYIRKFLKNFLHIVVLPTAWGREYN